MKFNFKITATDNSKYVKLTLSEEFLSSLESTGYNKYLYFGGELLDSS